MDHTLGDPPCGVPMSESSLEPHRRMRRPFLALIASYALGTFNDNHFKQAVMLIAVAMGRAEVQGYAAAAFTLPFVFLAAPAGWAADRFSKRTMVLGAKAIEIFAAGLGWIGLVTGHLGLMVGMVGLMGIQATFFSPALNGSIPELFPPHRVTQANAVLRLFITMAILTGTALAGIVLDIPGTTRFGAPLGRVLLGLAVIALAVLGFLVSLGIPRRPPADPTRPFPWSGPRETWSELRRSFRDAWLGTIILTDAYIWALGTLQLLLVNPLGLLQYRLGNRATSFLIAAQMVGIGLGGLLAARWAQGERWYRILRPAGWAMTLFLGGLAVVPFLPTSFQVPLLYPLLALVGASGGLILIPCESFIQVRPSAERKGAVWAAANGAVFAAIVAASVLSIPLNAWFRPTQAFGVLALTSALFSVALGGALRHAEGPRPDP